MDIDQVRVLASVLPERYEPLLLTFYGQQVRACGDHVIIGDDYGTELRVRLSDGAVFAIDSEGNLPTRFVNSCLEKLAEFIEIYRSFGGRASADAAVAPLAQKLRERLAAVDSAAFDDSENWWAVVLEQSVDGLL